MVQEFAKIINDLSREKGISKSVMLEALTDAISVGVNRLIGKYLEPEIEINLAKGIINIIVPKEVSEDVVNAFNEISLEEAVDYKEDPQLGDVIMVPISLDNLDRRAILIIKQRLIEKIKEAENASIQIEYGSKIYELVTGTVLKTERDYISINLGKLEARLPKREMIKGESFYSGDYIKAIILEIKEFRGNLSVILSRTHPKFLEKLFQNEIPEVFEGVIQVKGAAREPGERSKVAVYSLNENIDSVGSCIGLKGNRIRSISKELNGENIDVFQWSPNPVQFVCNAISPASVLVANTFEDEKTIEIVVPDDQLSLAIGRKGQNVRLAAMITDWRLDVLKESEYIEIRKQRLEDQELELKEFYKMYDLNNIGSLGQDDIDKLIKAGIENIEILSSSSVNEVINILDISEPSAIEIINESIDHITKQFEEHETDSLEEEV